MEGASLTVLGKRVCVSVEEQTPKKSKHGFVLPTEERDYFVGKVVSVGQEVSAVKSDDRVYVNKGNQIEVEKNVYLFPLDDVLAVVH